MQPAIKPGDKVTIATSSGHYSRYPYASLVGDVLGTNRFLVSAPILDGEIVHIPEGEEYRFVFYTEQGPFQAEGTVIEHCIQNKAHLMLVEVRNLRALQRRMFYRVNLIVEVEFDRRGRSPDQWPRNGSGLCRGVMSNVSGGGFRFACHADLAEGSRISCRFSLCGETFYSGGVIRSVERDEKSGLNVYGVEFIDMPEEIRDRIIARVFDIQRRAIARMRQEREERELKI